MPRLAVCILAKNEAANIAEAIKSVNPVADKVFVTDTGSADATISLASQEGADVDEWAWRDDFAAGWNHLLDRARPSFDWVLMLDADERLTAETQERLRPLLENADREVDAFSIQRLDLKDPQQTDQGTETRLLRLVRTRSDIRFIGRCHPHLIRDDFNIASSDLRLLHYGYLPNLLPQKAQRARRLLELELKDRPGQLYYLIELFRTQQTLGETGALQTLNLACDALAPHIESQRSPGSHAALLFEALLQLPASQLPQQLQPKKIQELADLWFPNAAPLRWTRARIGFADSDFSEARDQLKALVHLAETDSYDKHTSFDPSILGPQVKLNLAACHIKLGELEQAREQLKPLTNHPQLGPAALENLKLIEELEELP